MANEIKLEYRDFLIFFEEDIEKWKYSCDNEIFIADTLKEAKQSINKIILREKKSLTPFKAFYINNYSNRESKLIPVVVTNFTETGRVYLKPRDGQVSSDIPLFITYNSYDDGDIHSDSTETIERFKAFKTALDVRQKANEEMQQCAKLFNDTELSRKEIQVTLSPKLKMEEMKK